MEFEVIFALVYVTILVVGVTLGFIAFNKRKPSILFGDANVLHIIMGFFFPFVEIILGSIEIHSSK